MFAHASRRRNAFSRLASKWPRRPLRARESRTGSRPFEARMDRMPTCSASRAGTKARRSHKKLESLEDEKCRDRPQRQKPSRRRETSSRLLAPYRRDEAVRRKLAQKFAKTAKKAARRRLRRQARRRPQGGGGGGGPTPPQKKTPKVKAKAKATFG